MDPVSSRRLSIVRAQGLSFSQLGPPVGETDGPCLGEDRVDTDRQLVNVSTDRFITAAAYKGEPGSLSSRVISEG